MQLSTANLIVASSSNRFNYYIASAPDHRACPADGNKIFVMDLFLGTSM